MYRVIYYTMSGTRSKDFSELEKAQAFFNRQVKKHPEYQQTAWSKTELIHFIGGFEYNEYE